ncbi:MAG: hypothetical protein AB1Z98_25735, partial [Nannocystaceae bacterium]
VKAGHLLALRFVDPTPSQRAKLDQWVHGTLLQSAQGEQAVVLDLRALRDAAARSASTTAAGPSEPRDEPTEPRARPAMPPRGHTAIAGLPSPPSPDPVDTTALLGPALEPSPRTVETAVLLPRDPQRESAPHRPTTKTLASEAPLPPPTEGTVVLDPTPAEPSTEHTQVLDPTPPEPTVRYALPAMKPGIPHPIVPVPTPTIAMAFESGWTTHHGPRPSPLSSVEPPRPPPLLTSSSLDAPADAPAPAPAPALSRQALTEALALLGGRPPRPASSRPPRIVVSVPHYTLRGRGAHPWSS